MSIWPPPSHPALVDGEKCRLHRDSACQIFCISPTPMKLASSSTVVFLNLRSVYMLVSLNRTWAHGWQSKILTSILFRVCSGNNFIDTCCMYVLCKYVGESKKWEDSWAVSGGHMVILRSLFTPRKEADFSFRDCKVSFPLGLLGKNEEQKNLWSICKVKKESTGLFCWKSSWNKMTV